MLFLQGGAETAYKPKPYEQIARPEERIQAYGKAMPHSGFPPQTDGLVCAPRDQGRARLPQGPEAEPRRQKMNKP